MVLAMRTKPYSDGEVVGAIIGVVLLLACSLIALMSPFV